MPVTLAIDFGSTYTKVVAVDTDAGELIGVAQSPTTVSVVIAGNRDACEEVETILARTHCPATVVDNVLPDLGRLDVDPARPEIRRILWSESFTPRDRIGRSRSCAQTIHRLSTP